MVKIDFKTWRKKSPFLALKEVVNVFYYYYYYYYYFFI